MARPDKAASVAELTEEFRSSGAAVLTEYRGLTVSELTELRRALGKDVTYTVVKNTLTKIALKGSELPTDDASKLDALLEGPTAIAFVKGDAVDAAKGLRDFAKAHPLLVIKGGVLDNRALTPDEIKKLADLESREVLLAKLAGAMKASLSQAVALFAAPLSQAARLLAALQDQKSTEPQPAAEAPAPEAPEAEAPAAEAPAAEAASGDSAEAGDEVAAQAADSLEEASAEPLAEATPAADAPADTAPATDTATATDSTTEGSTTEGSTTPSTDFPATPES